MKLQGFQIREMSGRVLSTRLYIKTFFFIIIHHHDHHHLICFSSFLYISVYSQLFVNFQIKPFLFLNLFFSCCLLILVMHFLFKEKIILFHCASVKHLFNLRWFSFKSHTDTNNPLCFLFFFSLRLCPTK